jgi:hypothetical protein
MNDIGSLPAKHPPFGTPLQPQDTGKRQKGDSNFAAFLADGEAQPTRTAEQTGSVPRSPAMIPQSAVTREGSGSQDALTSGLKSAPAFFAAIAAGQTRYNAAPQVSDQAIAFNARPIVGPASFSHSPEEVFAALEDVNGAQFAAARADVAASVGIDEGHVVLKLDQPSVAQRSTAAATPKTTPAPGTASPTIQAFKARQIDATLQPPQIGNSAKSGANLEASTRSTSRQSSSAPVLAVHLTGAQNPAFAQLLASPSEYRLVIRGQRLSEDMRELVLRAVRSGLSEYGLPNRPLEIFEQEGQH